MSDFVTEMVIDFVCNANLCLQPTNSAWHTSDAQIRV